MGNIKSFVLAGAAVFASIPAFAADLAPLMQRGPMMAPVAEEFGGWYLRGDVGVGSQSFDSFDFTQTNAATGGAFPASFRIDQKGINDTAFVGFGIGYQFNSWLRADVTGEYRASSKFKSIASYTEFCPGGRCFDVYDGSHQANVFMANAYIDLGTWWCLTPFIGAGAGFAQHNITGLTDVGYITGPGASALGFPQTDRTEWKFAWAVHAGLAYSVTNNVKLELAYRYLNMGDAVTSEINCGGGGCNVVGGGPRAFYTLTNMSSQDIKLGVRWMFNEPSVAPPLVRKG